MYPFAFWINGNLGAKYVCFLQLQYPVYWDLMEFCDGFRKLLDHLQLDKVSLCFSPPSFCKMGGGGSCGR